MNPITQHARFARSQMPKGSGHRSRAKGVFRKPSGRSGRTHTYTNLDIVQMRLNAGDKEGARRLIAEIQSGAKKALAAAK